MSGDWGNDGLPTSDDSQFVGGADGFGDWDASDIDGDKVGSGQLYVDKPGFFHFHIAAEARPELHQKGDLSKPRMPTISCKCTVLKGANNVPADAVHYHDVIMGGKGGGVMEDWAKEQTLNFLVGLGVLKVVDGRVIDPQTGTTKIKSSTLVERINQVGQFIGKLNLSPEREDKRQPGKMYPAKIEFPFGRGAFPVTAKEVAHVPSNEEYLKAAGIERSKSTINV